MGPQKDIKNFNPFPGLRHFTPEDSTLFFGREAESNEVIMKLLKNRYITVIGASGNGKSSLIYGGVLPKIMNLKVRESSVWRVISFKPGSDPFGNLATALLNGMTDAGQKNIGKDIILARLLDNPGSLSDIVRKYIIKQDSNVIIVIDQLEELFRYSSAGKSKISTATLKKFVDLLVKSAVVPEENVFIIVTMRSEYLGECSHYKGLTMFVNNSNYLLPEMGMENLIEAIEGPVNYAGAKIDPKLVDLILNDLNDQRDQLQLLQHVMMRTWAHWKELDDRDKPISKADYDSTGTIKNAVSLHTDQVYEELNQIGKEICAAMFKTITGKGSDNKGVRNPSDVETIKSIAGCTDEELFYVIEKFRSASRSFITPAEDVVLNGNSVIDVHYEFLIRKWDRLRDWIDDEAYSREMYLRLSDASALYQQGKTGLYRPPELLAAIDWRNKNKPALSWAVQYNPAFERAMVYLRTSENAYLIEEKNKVLLQKRKIRRTRLTTRILGITLLAALGFMFFAYVQKSAAVRQSILAEKLRIQAVKGKAVADSFAVIVFNHKVISDSTTAAAIEDAKEARAEVTAADVQKTFAEEHVKEALHQKSIAIEQRDEARRMRMLSVGKSMSLKSLQMAGQKDLQTLLAYQAYQFNKMNNGPVNDADIYAGLYNVALQYGGNNIRSYKGHNGGIKSIAFLPGGKEFFTSGDDGQVLKWSPDKNDQTLQVMYSGNDIIEVMAVSPDASWLACGSSNASIKMLPLKGNISGYEMNGHKGGIKSLIFSYDGRFLYSASLDGQVLKWDIAARTSINVSTGLMEITSIDISPKGNYLAGIGTDGNVVVWNPERSSDNFRIETSGKNVKVVRFNPGNNLLALGDADGTVEMWDLGLHKKLSEVKAHNGQVNDIQFNTALNQMATAGNDKKLEIFNIKDPYDLTEPPVTLADNENFVLVMKFSPDGKMIISGESTGGHNLISRPTHADYLAQDMCNMITRNMTQEEWNIYVGKDIPFEKTCPNKSFNIKVEQIKSLNK